MDILFGLFGLSVLVSIAWLFSNNKKAVDWKLVGTGVVLQILFAMFVLLTPWGAAIFNALAHFPPGLFGRRFAKLMFWLGKCAPPIGCSVR